MKESTESPCPKCGAVILEGAPQGLCPKCVLGGAATLPDVTSSPGRKTQSPIVEELAPHFPDLEILELIGAGGMGAVYKARQTKLDRIVALKILAHDLGEDPAFAERFNREGRVLARLSHPNIVTVFDTGTAGPYAYLLMEYVDGVNLRQAMRTGGFTPSEALTLIQDICAALKFAHEEGILHRDIKPENILIDSRGLVKIADFGIAKLVADEEQDDVTLTLDGSILGSPQYMAPEQIETPGDVDQRADIYSLGVVLYEMLTGELPLGRFALPSEKSDLDSRIDNIVLRTLAKEREARFQTAGEVGTEVEAIQDTPGQSKSSPPAASGQVDWLKESSKIVFILAFVPLVIFLFEGWTESEDTETLLEAAERFPIYAGIAVLLGTVSGILAGLHRLNVGGGASRSTSDMARHAFLSAVLTGISLSLALATIVALPFLSRGTFPPGAALSPAEQAELSSKMIVPGVMVGANLLVACVTGILGVIFGFKALGEIRRSDGRKGGLGSALFGALAWPVLLILFFVAALFQATMGLSESGVTAPPIPIILLAVATPVALFFFVRKVKRWASCHRRETGAGDSQTDAAGDLSQSDFEESGTAPSATASAILAGCCLLLCGWTYFLWNDSEGAVHTVGGWMALTAVAVLPPLIPGILAMVFGRKVLRSVRRSGGRQEGFLRGLIGFATLPVIVLTVIATAVATGYRPSPAFLWREEPSSITKLEGSPKVELDLTVAPTLLATYELVRTDAVGEEKILEEFQGFVLASDEAPWKGKLQLATIKVSDESREMAGSVDSDTEEIMLVNDKVTPHFAREWNWNSLAPSDLELSEPGLHLFEVASRSDLSQTLSLRVEARPRRIPDIPAEGTDLVALATALRGRGGDIEWVRYLVEELGVSWDASGIPELPDDPEPEWREGKPESHVNLTIDPGMVAQIELTAPDGSGRKKTYSWGYIVASDLEPWEGKLRVGSLAGSSKIQWRIDGPFDSLAVDIEPGWEWQVEPMVTNSRVTKPGWPPTVKVIAAGRARSGGDASPVSFIVTCVERKRVLPEVLTTYYLGIGDDDWTDHIKSVIEPMDPE